MERPVLWTPSPDRVARASITRYQAWLSTERGVSAATYADLWKWSTDDLDGFWASIVQFCDVEFDTPATAVLADERMPGAVWFPGGTLNFAAHAFRDRDPAAVAIRHASELRPLSVWTWGDLHAETARLAAGLRALGVGPGDRVAAYMPNIPETVAAFLACASIGAIWSSAAPEFGPRSVIDRFSQIEPTVLLAVDGYRYGGKEFDRSEQVERIAAALPSAPTVVRFGYLDGNGWGRQFADPVEPELSFVPVPFEHPLWVLYSSGTTGLPKPIVHSQGGIMLELLKHHDLHLDAQAGDRVFWFTTTGWVMWNVLVGVLLTDAEIVLYDGNPGYPSLDTLWQLAADAGITAFGTSPAFISSCMKAGVQPGAGRDLSALTGLGATGSPLSDDGFRWVYEQLGDNTWLFSISGGTDVCGPFVAGVPTLPVRLGELQALALGCAVEAWDPAGRPLTGEMGELVVTRPMPSMPVSFWGDDSGERYRESYFTMFPGVWRHGDWLEITPGGGAIIHGRSDATINRAGVRIGTSEIYAAVLALDEITDALVVDLPGVNGPGTIELFVVLRDGLGLTDELEATIRRVLREECSPRHVPDRIAQVSDVPRTLSGKLLELPVKRILSGVAPEQAASRESLANPAALDAFVALAAETAPHRS
jgi:acetoacetyl-CoA synthetase